MYLLCDVSFLYAVSAVRLFLHPVVFFVICDTLLIDEEDN